MSHALVRWPISWAYGRRESQTIITHDLSPVPLHVEKLSSRMCRTGHFESANTYTRE